MTQTFFVRSLCLSGLGQPSRSRLRHVFHWAEGSRLPSPGPRAPARLPSPSSGGRRATSPSIWSAYCHSNPLLFLAPLARRLLPRGARGRAFLLLDLIAIARSPHLLQPIPPVAARQSRQPRGVPRPSQAFPSCSPDTDLTRQRQLPSFLVFGIRSMEVCQTVSTRR